MKRTAMWLLCTAVIVGAVASVRAEKPEGVLRLHPENSRYFLWRGEPTVLITSGEHYGAVLNLDFDYKRYLATLSADGLNLTRTFSGTYREVASSFGITDNPLAPKPLRYICPWARSDTPGYYDGGNKFDLKKWDPAYFARLHDFMREAARCGVVVEYNLFCPMYRDELWQACPMNIANNINGVGDVPRTEVYTLDHADLWAVQAAFVEKVVTELKDYDNLYYEVCNEPYFGGVRIEWRHAVADKIRAVEDELGVRHLISMNIANGRAKVENPHPAVSIFNFHYCVPPDVVALNAHLKGVIGENETGFRGKDDLLYRTEGWDFILAGGGLYNNLDYSFTPKTPDGTLRDYRSPGGGSPELRNQLGILKRFVESFDFIRMKPDTKTIRDVSPALTTSCLSNPGEAYAVYLHVPLPNKPKGSLEEYRKANLRASLTMNVPAGAYRVEWWDTKTGRVVRDVVETGDGGLRLQSPRFDDDIALRVVRSRK
ncbi:hypothetical protein JCM19992_09770 [Thermostilla marina]